MGKRISELDQLGEISGEELVPVSINGASYRVPISIVNTIINKQTLSIDNVDNTSDADKPISTATQTALDGKANAEHIHEIDSIFHLRQELDSKARTDHIHTKAEVGLGNVDNTSDINKPVSNDTRAALDGKADLNHNHSKADIGLSNVDNTSDLAKPISAATQTALNSKADVSHSHTKNDIGLGNVDNTSDINKPISSATQSALNQKVDSSKLAVANGVATLDNSGVLSPQQIPNIVNQATQNLISNTAAQANNYTDLKTLDAINTALDNSTPISHLTAGSDAHQLASSEVAGFISQSDKIKLDTIEVSANNYVHPEFHTPSEIALDSQHRFVTDDQITSWTGKIDISEKGMPDGVATLNSSGQIPASQLPSYVDDVIEIYSFQNLPIEGESSKIYLTKDTNKIYRWSGSIYIDLSPFTGVTLVSSVNGLNGDVVVDKNTLGLENVDNTSDLAKPISTATATALNNLMLGKASLLHGHSQSDIVGLDDTLIEIHQEINTKSGIGHTHGITDVTDLQTTLDGKANLYHGHIKSEVGLSNVDNTSDLDKPISTATATALSGKSDITHVHNTATMSVSGFMSNTDKLKLDGIDDNANNYTHPTFHSPSIIAQDTNNRFVSDADINTWNSKQNALGYTPEDTASKGQPNGYASLDATGKVPASQLPSYVDDVLEYNLITELPAIGAFGVIYLITSENRIYRWTGTQYLNLGLANSDIPVNSVNGKTGNVIITKTDLGIENIDNTSDLAKPISTATQTALNTKVDFSQLNNYYDKPTIDIRFSSELSTKANVTHMHVISDVVNLQTILDGKSSIGHTHTKADIGLGNVDNTSDVNKPLSTAQKNYVDTAIASIPTGGSGAVSSVAGRTGDVVLTKTDVGLSNVDNTSDINKPVSTAQAAANTSVQNAAATDATTKANAAQAAAIAASAPISHVGSGGTSHAAVTTTVNGFMSAADKVKLDAITGVNTGDQTTITGNAGTATKLQTARTINGVSFDGSANITINAVDSTARIASTEKGAVNGVATLDATGKVPSTQLPSYVDDVLEYNNLASFPATGSTGIIYVAKDTNKVYRWSGSAYVYITSGAVDSVNGKTGIVVIDKTDIGLTNVDNTSDINKPLSNSQKNYVDPQMANVFRAGSYGGAAIMLEPMSIMVDGEPQLLFNNSGSIIVSGVL